MILKHPVEYCHWDVPWTSKYGTQGGKRDVNLRLGLPPPYSVCATFSLFSWAKLV